MIETRHQITKEHKIGAARGISPLSQGSGGETEQQTCHLMCVDVSLLTVVGLREGAEWLVANSW